MIMGLLKIFRSENSTEEHTSSDNTAIKMDNMGTETLTLIVTDDDNEETHQEIAEYEDTESAHSRSQIPHQLSSSNSSLLIKNAKQLIETNSSRTFKLGSASVKLISKPNVFSEDTKEFIEDRSFRLRAKRKVNFEDFEESDLDDPKKAKIVWGLAKQEINLKNSRIDLLEKNNAKLAAKIYELKDLRNVKRKNYILNQEVLALRQLLDLKNFHKALGDVLDI